MPSLDDVDPRFPVKLTLLQKDLDAVVGGRRLEERVLGGTWELRW